MYNFRFRKSHQTSWILYCLIISLTSILPSQYGAVVQRKTYSLLYTGMAERTFSLEIQWFEPVITLNCSIICIGKQGKLYSLNFIFHVIPTNWNLALPYHCKFLFSRIIIYTFRLDTKFFSQIKLNCSLIFLINVQF